MKCEIEFPDDLEAWKTHRLAGECRKVKRGEWYLGDDGKAWQWTSNAESTREESDGLGFTRRPR